MLCLTRLGLHAVIAAAASFAAVTSFFRPQSSIHSSAAAMVVTPNLPRIASYTIKKGTSFSLVFSRGSVVDFNYPSNPAKSAIVNAANEGCLGGGGVDGAISDAGGPNLYRDREALPVLRGGVRCPTGDAKLTGPGSYGSLNVPYVIHAVGPNYDALESLEEGDVLLKSAYTESLKRGKEAKLEAIAFSLLSSGIFRGERSKKEVLKIGVEAICDFDGYNELKEVHMCAFSSSDGDILKEIAGDLGLLRKKSASSSK